MATLLTLQFVRSPKYADKKSASRSRLARYFLLAITVGSLQYILERGHEDDWFESKVITTLTLTSFFGFIFFYLERTYL